MESVSKGYVTREMISSLSIELVNLNNLKDMSVGTNQRSIGINHGNLLGFGDRLNFEYAILLILCAISLKLKELNLTLKLNNGYKFILLVLMRSPLITRLNASKFALIQTRFINMTILIVLLSLISVTLSVINY
jgi:hypothetical protein